MAKGKSKKKAVSNEEVVESVKASTPAPKAKSVERDLTRNSQGDDVKAVQKAIGGLEVDGDFGFTTLVAVKKWQNKNGLVPDGIVGPKTKAKLLK